MLFSCCSVAQSCMTLRTLSHHLPWESYPSSSPEVCPSLCPWHQWCLPATSSFDALFSFCPQCFPASGIFTESAVRIRWPKYWSFFVSISPSNEYPALISFVIDWFDLLAVQRTFRNLLQNPSSVLHLLYSPALTTVCDHWQDHNLDYKDLCRQSNVSAFQHIV